MSNNSFSETTSESWGSRILHSIKSVVFGVLLFLCSFILLWWNEGRTLKTAQGLDEGAGQVVHIDAKQPDSANEGKLVHLSDSVHTKDILKDDEFSVSINALKLQRVTEMYQWYEEKETIKEKKLGGKEETTTTYNYKKKWSVDLIDSDDFKISEDHTNPTAFEYDSYTRQANQAIIGEYTLSNSLLTIIDNFNAIVLTEENSGKIEHSKLITEEGNSKIYVGKGTKSTPKIGDLKISFKSITSGQHYSIISKQIGTTFESFHTSTETTINLITPGNKSAEVMFIEEQEKNTVMAWILRLSGFLMMFFGCMLIFKPLVVLADVIPFIGTLLDTGLSLFSGIICFALSFLTIAMAWIFYRPFIGISLLVIGIGSLVFFYTKASKRNQKYMKSNEVKE